MVQHQAPTCTELYIRSTFDAQVLFHAVRLGVLPMTSRRLDTADRSALRSGCVYVWQQSDSDVDPHGIKRFTEGRRWEPSRLRDGFLIYQEKNGQSQTAPLTRDRSSPGGITRYRATMVKKTYSVWVELPHGKKKWHLNAYYSNDTISQLRTVNTVPQLRDIVPPNGAYQCARIGKPGRRGSEEDDDDDEGGHSPQNVNAVRLTQAYPHSNPYPATGLASSSSSIPSSPRSQYRQHPYQRVPTQMLNLPRAISPSDFSSVSTQSPPVTPHNLSPTEQYSLSSGYFHRPPPTSSPSMSSQNPGWGATALPMTGLANRMGAIRLIPFDELASSQSHSVHRIRDHTEEEVLSRFNSSRTYH